MSPRWPFYLPVNPCCNTTPCDPCTNPCSDTSKQSDYIIYTGPNLPCLGIETNDTLTTVIEKIEEKYCEFTTTTTSTTVVT